MKINTDLSWTPRASCRGTNPEVFYPRAGGGNAHDERKAKAMCRDCPVALQCLELAMQNEGTIGAFHRFGIFGGLTPTERANLAHGRDAQIEDAA